MREKQTNYWATDAKKILISYCQRDHHNTGFVAGLVTDLNRQGFSVVWDHSTPSPKNWHTWFKKNLRRADFLLVVFSENYKICWDDPEGYDHSAGIYQEIRHIQGNLHSAEGEKEIENWKIVPVYRSNQTSLLNLGTERSRLVPKEFQSGQWVFGLRTRQSKRKLYSYLQRKKPPVNFGKYGKSGLRIKRIIEYLSLIHI